MIVKSTIHSISNLHEIISVVRALFLPLDHLYLLQHIRLVLRSTGILLDLAGRLVAPITHNLLLLLLLSLRHVLNTAPLASSSYFLLEIGRRTMLRLVSARLRLLLLHHLLLLFEK